MQHITVTTHLTARAADGGISTYGHDYFTLTRNTRLEPWKILNQPFTLFEIRPGESYTLYGNDCNRVVTVSPIER